MLKGEAKRVYQREYMRRRRAGLTGRSNKGLTQTVRPDIPELLRPAVVIARPQVDADGNIIPDY